MDHVPATDLPTGPVGSAVPTSLVETDPHLGGTITERSAGLPQAVPLGLTYDDVLVQPAESDVVPSRVDTTTRMTRNITIAMPLLSSPMDTVTEARMAIAMARQGGMGVLHRNLSVEDQAMQVDLVKRSESGMITNPITCSPDDTVRHVDELCGRYRISGVPVVDADGLLVGIVTNRDMRFVADPNVPVREVMTRMPLITAPVGVSKSDALELLRRHKVEKLPLVDDSGRLRGLITVKDFTKSEQFPHATKDEVGRLRVAAAVGVGDDAYKRARTLVDAGVDVLVVDTAHGHQEKMIKALRAVRSLDPQVPVVAGNVVTAEGTRDLIEAGADIVKVGVGPGAMCTTRMATGVGRPQFSAVVETAAAARALGKHVWADGGIRHPRDVALALAAGASAVMIGSWFAGTYESPGDLHYDEHGRPYKESFGMASKRAVEARTRSENPYEKARKALFEEGISSSRMALDPARPSVEDLLDAICAGVRSACTYTGAANLEEFHRRAVVGVQSAAGFNEGRPLPSGW